MICNEPQLLYVFYVYSVVMVQCCQVTMYCAVRMARRYVCAGLLQVASPKRQPFGLGPSDWFPRACFAMIDTSQGVLYLSARLAAYSFAQANLV